MLFLFNFSGITVQLLHDLNKNVYTVNPESVSLCGMSREDGLFGLGTFLVLIQIAFTLIWNLTQTGNVVCTSAGYFECENLANFHQYFFYTLSYPVFLGFFICVLSGLSLKWKTNSGATWNLLALTGTVGTWVGIAVVDVQVRN